MQYKIPIQIENEDIITLWLSLRQIAIIMIWSGLWYGVFKSLETSVSPQIWLAAAAPFVIIGITVALVRVAEMTFLPMILNLIRMNLNARARMWSQGTDGFSDIEVWYVTLTEKKAELPANDSFSTAMEKNDQILNTIKKL